jgi:hypothetical protein
MESSSTPQPETVAAQVFPGAPASKEGIKAIYFNGFAVALSACDVSIPIMRNGVHFATLNVSFSMAKTLAHALHQMIEEMEKTTKNRIMTAEELQKALEK